MTRKTTMKVYEALRWASSFLQQHDYESTIGERLLLHHTGWDRTRLLMEYQTTLDDSLITIFQQDVTKAAKGTPVQHITGEETFYGRSYYVNEHVLIPRPETEELIEAVLAKVRSLLQYPNGDQQPAHDPLQIVDVGTGSGIIAITLALELSNSHVTAIDISKKALETAEANRRRHDAPVRLLEGDLLEPLSTFGEKVSVVISNPPYIPERDRSVMKANVVGHEPHLALFAGQDGLDIYRKLVKQIPKILQSPGIIAFEIGHGQGEAVQNLIKNEYPHGDIEVLYDINGKERVVIAVIK